MEPWLKASAYGSRVGWTPARRIHTYMEPWLKQALAI